MKTKKFAPLLYYYWNGRDLDRYPLHDLKWALPSEDLLATIQLTTTPDDAPGWLTPERVLVIEATAVYAFCTILRKEGASSSYYEVAKRRDRDLAEALRKLAFTQSLMLQVLAGKWQAAKLLLKEGGLAAPEWLSYNPSLLPEAMRQALIIEDCLGGPKPSTDWKPVLLQGGSQRS